MQHFVLRAESEAERSKAQEKEKQNQYVICVLRGSGGSISLSRASDQPSTHTARPQRALGGGCGGVSQRR
jgi:hypothetical protein